jgi:hypothetical protein
MKPIHIGNLPLIGKRYFGENGAREKKQLITVIECHYFI